ncbi:hypothetical protein HDU97_008545 [Phlyctochytrium planicorne]|nr:hypothetical protein HDU97_008545 [Phlyctochytrium planicorne]
MAPQKVVTIFNNGIPPSPASSPAPEPTSDCDAIGFVFDFMRLNGTECCGMIDIIPDNIDLAILPFFGFSNIECNNDGRIVKWDMMLSVGGQVGCNSIICPVVPLDPLSHLTELEEMYISGDLVGALPPSVGLMDSLETLRIDGNGWAGLTPETLEEQSIIHRRTLSIPNEISDVKNLKSLTLSLLRLSLFPRSFANSNLETLVMDNCLLDGPGWEWLGTMKTLKELTLIGPNMVNHTQEFSKLTQLTFLAITNAGIETVPDEISKIPLLKTLELPNNGIKKVPASFRELKVLENLNLDGNLISLPLSNIAFEHSRSSLAETSWSFVNTPVTTGLEAIIPEVLLTMESLQTLYLGSNKFSERLLDFLGGLPASKLKFIDLGGNYFYGRYSNTDLKTFANSIGNVTMSLRGNCFSFPDLGPSWGVYPPKNIVYVEDSYDQNFEDYCIDSIFQLRIENLMPSVTATIPTTSATTAFRSSAIPSRTPFIPIFTITKVQGPSVISRTWTRPDQTVTQGFRELVPGPSSLATDVRILEKIVAENHEGKVVIGKEAFAGIVAVVALVSVLVSFAVVMLIGKAKRKSRKDGVIREDGDGLGDFGGYPGQGGTGSTEDPQDPSREVEETIVGGTELFLAPVLLQDSTIGNGKTPRGVDGRHVGLFEEVQMTTLRMQDSALKQGGEEEGLFETVQQAESRFQDVEMEVVEDDVVDVKSGSEEVLDSTGGVVSGVEDNELSPRFLPLQSGSTETSSSDDKSTRVTPVNIITLADEFLAKATSPLSSSKSVHHWTPDEVCLWMDSVGFREDVCDKFREHAVDGQGLLGLTDRILKEELGIEPQNLRNAILSIRGKSFLEGRVLSSSFLPAEGTTPRRQNSLADF